MSLVVGVMLAGGLFAGAAPARAGQADKPKERRVEYYAHLTVSAGGTTLEFSASACGLHATWQAFGKLTGPFTAHWGYEWTFTRDPIPRTGDVAQAKQLYFDSDFPVPLSVNNQPFRVELGGSQDKPVLILDSGLVNINVVVPVAGSVNSGGTRLSHSIPITTDDLPCGLPPLPPELPPGVIPAVIPVIW